MAEPLATTVTDIPDPLSRSRLSGEDLGRIISLSDGVFAFALTLLVLSLTVPSFPHGGPSAGQLGAALNGDWAVFVGYGFAFVMIALWWITHNRTFQGIGRFDSGLVWLNMALLLQVAVMPFVLEVYTTYSGLWPAVDLFAGIQVTLGLTNAAIWEHGRRRGLLARGVRDATAAYFRRRSLLIAAVFGISMVIALRSVGYAQLVWVFVFVSQRFAGKRGD